MKGNRTFVLLIIDPITSSSKFPRFRTQTWAGSVFFFFFGLTRELTRYITLYYTHSESGAALCDSRLICKSPHTHLAHPRTSMSHTDAQSYCQRRLSELAAWCSLKKKSFASHFQTGAQSLCSAGASLRASCVMTLSCLSKQSSVCTDTALKCTTAMAVCIKKKTLHTHCGGSTNPALPLDVYGAATLHSLHP